MGRAVDSRSTHQRSAKQHRLQTASQSGSCTHRLSPIHGRVHPVASLLVHPSLQSIPSTADIEPHPVYSSLSVIGGQSRWSS